jgi:hypothetical protein
LAISLLFIHTLQHFSALHSHLATFLCSSLPPCNISLLFTPTLQHSILLHLVILTVFSSEYKSRSFSPSYFDQHK